MSTRLPDYSITGFAQPLFQIAFTYGLFVTCLCFVLFTFWFWTIIEFNIQFSVNWLGISIIIFDLEVWMKFKRPYAEPIEICTVNSSH